MKPAIVISCFLLSVFFAVQTDKYAEALKFYDKKQYTASITICTYELERLSYKDTLTIKFLSLRASSYLELRDFELAIKDYKKLTDLKPNNISWYMGLSYSYGENKEYTDCMNTLKTALSIDPKNIDLYNNLSYYSAQYGNYGDAVKFANNGLEYVKDQSWRGSLLNNRGYGYIGLKQYSKALDDINESIKLNAGNSFAYCYRAIANIGLKKMETVCDDLNKAKNLGATALTADLIKQYCKK
jgi:tetratricopeptide (TPR) repeat protein